MGRDLGFGQLPRLLGWVLIVLGIIQLSGGFSLISGKTYGRIIGMGEDERAPAT